MTYLATSINESPTITEKAGVALSDVRGKAVKFDGSGKIALCAAGETAIGVGILTNDAEIPAGADVDIQIKDIGHVRAGSTIVKGEELAVGDDGKFVPAADGDFVCAIALESAGKADIYIRARLVAYNKANTGSNIKVSGGTELTNAIAAVKDGGTVTLANDLNLTEKLTIDKSLTLNLNGKTLSTTADIWSKSGTLTIKNGTVEAAADAFVVGDYLGGKEKATGDSTLIIGEGVTINVTGDGCNCVYVRSSDHEASVITAGNLTAKGAAIQGNGISRGNVTVTGGRIESLADTAIYHPQDGVLTVTGGEIVGKTGIEIRAGELNITGGKIAATTDAFSGMKPNGNGTTVEYGAAVAVSQHNTNKRIDVCISNGTFDGFYALYENDVEDESTGEGIAIHINGGKFNGSIESENVTNFIFGGKFKDAVTVEQCAAGLTPATKPNASGYYTVA